MPAETHSHGGPLDPEEVSTIVRDRLAEILGVDDERLTPDADLREELGADDFALLDFVEVLEHELGERTVGFRIDDDDLGELVTVGDAIECVLNRIQAEADRS